jgi:dihydrofolate reductase
MGVVFGGMAASLDGYIASNSGDLSWLNDAMRRGEDYGFAETMKRTGAFVIGARTYEGMLEQGMAGGKDTVATWVVTHRTLKTGTRTKLYSGDLAELVSTIKAETDKDVCVFGGGNLVTQFLDLGLIDEIGISIIPVVLGEGVRFFGSTAGWKRLELAECKQFPSGIVLLNYRVKQAAAPRKRRPRGEKS